MKKIISLLASIAAMSSPALPLPWNQPVPAAATGFSPSGELYWWNPNSGVTTSGGNVTAWLDQVSSLSLSQATAAKGPTEATTNGNTMLLFSTSQLLTNMTAATMSQPIMIMFIAASPQPTTGMAMLGNTQSSGNYFVVQQPGNTGIQLYAGAGLNGTQQLNTALYVFTFYASGASSFIRTNGVLEITGNAGGTGWASGVELNGYDLGQLGKFVLGDVVIWTANIPTGASLSALEVALAAKYGLTIP